MKTSIVDTPEFADLNTELREGIRLAETMMRQGMTDLLQKFPAQLRPVLAALVDEAPATMLLAQLPLYRHLDSIGKIHERLTTGNPAELGKQ